MNYPTSIFRLGLVLFLGLALSQTACDPDDVLPFIVNTTQDTHDALVGDNLCADVNGNCSLRAAVEEANSANKTYTITIPPGVYPLDEKLFVQTGIISFQGAGKDVTIIDGQSDAAILFHVQVLPNQTLSIVALSDLTLKGATNDQFGQQTNGGGGAVRVEENVSLVLNSVSIEENRARFHGAAVYNKGTVSINNSIVRNNATTLRAGGAFFNTASGRLTFNSCAIYNNIAADDNNLSPGNRDGGAIYNLGGILSLNNTTLSGNAAPVGLAGGIYNAQNGSLSLNNVTLTENIGRGNTQGPGIFVQSGNVVLRNSIVARNYLSFVGGLTKDIAGTVTTGGGNLIGNNADLVLNGNPASPDQVGTPANQLNPNLTNLQFFQGTYVHKPQAGSPAIDNASALAPGSSAEACRTNDQAGQARVGVCDCGAFERQVQ